MTAPRVSVVLPVRNGDNYLANALDSIIGQTFPHLELIVVDDGSTDGTAEVLARYRARDRRVRVYRQDHSGQAAALNTGCYRAAGYYLAIMDHDDVAVPDRLERQVRFLDATPGAVLVGGAAVVTDADGKEVETVRYPSSDEELRRLLPHRNVFSHPTVLLRWDTFVAAGGYRRAAFPAEDYDLWLRLSEMGTVHNLAAPLVRYRVHPAQLSRVHDAEMAMAGLAIQRAARIRREGRRDPLWDARRVTLELLAELGVGRGEIEAAIAARRQRWARRITVGTEVLRGDT